MYRGPVFCKSMYHYSSHINFLRSNEKKVDLEKKLTIDDIKIADEQGQK